MILKGFGPPSAQTVAKVGDKYFDQESCKTYECVGVKGSTVDYGFVDIYRHAPENEYEWKDSGAIAIHDADYMFYKGHRLDLVGDFDFSPATTFESAFDSCSSLTEAPAMNTGNATNFKGMFSSCSAMTRIPNLDTSKGTCFWNMFNGCKALKEVPNLDTSSGTDFTQMFRNCSSLTSVPWLDTSKGTDFAGMFSGCSGLTEIPDLDTSNGNGSSVFYGCSNLASVPNWDFSNFEYFTNMFENCTSLTTVELDNVGACKGFGYAFQGCTNLISVSLDVGNITNYSDFNNMFKNCTNLTTLDLRNIRAAITIGSGTSWGHLLTTDSLVNVIRELCNVSAARILTMGAANLAKIANLYCKVIDDSTEKIEMELCESTDEGAMTLTAYAALKNWTFK